MQEKIKVKITQSTKGFLSGQKLFVEIKDFDEKFMKALGEFPKAKKTIKEKA